MLAELVGLLIRSLFVFLAAGDRLVRTFRNALLGNITLVAVMAIQTKDADVCLMTVVAGSFTALALSLFVMYERMAALEPYLSDVRYRDDGFEILLRGGWTPLSHYSDLEGSIYGLLSYSIASTAILVFSRGLLLESDSLASVILFAINVGALWAFSLASTGHSRQHKIAKNTVISTGIAMLTFVIEVIMV